MKKSVVNILKSCSDIEYKNFQSGLMPSVARDSIIGVRTPILRKIAKDIIKSDGADDFIADLPHKYFEENQLHAFILSELQDFDVVIKKVSCFLPHIDNWATCDQMSPKVFVKNADKLLPYIEKWIKSKHVYTVRFGVLCLMRYLLDDNFNSKYADMVADIKSEEYYINMMRAWYFATATAKHFDDTLTYFRAGRIDEWTRRRAIQKAIESYRVSKEHKQKLKSLK